MLHSFFEGKDPATPWMDGKLALSTGEAARKAVLQHHIQDVNPMLSSKIMVEEGTKIIHTFGIEHVEELHLVQLFYAIAKKPKPMPTSISPPSPPPLRHG